MYYLKLKYVAFTPATAGPQTQPAAVPSAVTVTSPLLSSLPLFVTT